ncbi:MAG: nucleoside-diphosphate sugar epimerase [Parcubacteria group bacterium RIFCSPHIGHO2_01_FULL_56_18]|nr:MAG: nucleoside-diphosphate sugar epimerase [Parcubacteria group bacterium RIFCSPHIGHO2_01_FULL_56_18]
MQSVKGKKIVLIGGAGFIGHHLALHLAAAGAEVHVIDSLQVNNWLTFSSSRHRGNHRELYLRMLSERLDLLRAADVPLHVEDARDYHLLSRQLADIGPDRIVHLAAVAHAGASNKDPYSTFDHSLRTLENALDFARDRGVEQFVYFSSSMVYGNFPKGLVTEETVCNPLGIYGALKFAGEKLVIAYNQVFNLPYTIVRPSALYGPRCVSRRVVQIFVENALRGEEAVIEGDGSDTLDFTYIDDLVAGLTLVLGNEAAHNNTFNLTFGEARSISELVEILRHHFPALNVTYGQRDRLVPERGTLSVARAQRVLGYAPQHNLERGAAAYLNWYRSFVAPERTPAQEQHASS